ncbi:hypothetical protein RIR_jg40458.t1 [Rhizophagus irregularis DAOM 181602=DAOM 197198]|nr:hypothetical protein RIR_jg40458.t1 [Rhizophagus irregularis DAOM 181602=DAOM 197198]
MSSIYWSYADKLINYKIWDQSCCKRGFSVIKPGPDDRQSGIRLRFSANYTISFGLVLYYIEIRDYGSRVLFQVIKQAREQIMRVNQIVIRISSRFIITLTLR